MIFFSRGEGTETSPLPPFATAGWFSVSTILFTCFTGDLEMVLNKNYQNSYIHQVICVGVCSVSDPYSFFETDPDPAFLAE
jgi:hypothetical protein